MRWIRNTRVRRLRNLRTPVHIYTRRHVREIAKLVSVYFANMTFLFRFPREKKVKDKDGLPGCSPIYLLRGRFHTCRIIILTIPLLNYIVNRTRTTEVECLEEATGGFFRPGEQLLIKPAHEP